MLNLTDWYYFRHKVEKYFKIKHLKRCNINVLSVFHYVKNRTAHPFLHVMPHGLQLNQRYPQ